MNTWLLLSSAEDRNAKAVTRDLAWVAGKSVVFRQLEIPAGPPSGDTAASFAAFLKQNRQAVGVIVQDLAHVPLLADCPPWMKRVLLLDRLAGWQMGAPLTQLHATLTSAIAHSRRATAVDFCAPRSGFWSGLAALLFPSSQILPPLPMEPRRAERRGAQPCLGTLLDAGAAYGRGMVSCLSALTSLHGEESAHGPGDQRVVLVPHALLEQVGFSSPDAPFTLRSVESPPGRPTSGGDAIVLPQVALVDAEAAARVAAATASPLLIWSADTSKSGGLGHFQDASGVGVAVSELLGDGSAFQAMAERFAGPSEAIHAHALASWRARVFGQDVEVPAAAVSGRVSDAVYATWVNQALSLEERLRREWVVRPQDPAPLLRLAIESLDFQPELGWQLVELAQAMSRLSGHLPAAPDTPIQRPRGVFVATPSLTAGSWSGLDKWLRSLPKQPVPAPLDIPLVFEKPQQPAIAEFGADHVFGLVQQDYGRYTLGNQGCLAMLSLAEIRSNLGLAEDSEERVVAQLSIQLERVKPDWLSGLEVRLNGLPVSLFVNAGSDSALLTGEVSFELGAGPHLRFQMGSAVPPETPVVLTGLSLGRPAAVSGDQGLRPAHLIALDKQMTAQGMFDTEIGEHGPCRWVDAEFTLTLPQVIGGKAEQAYWLLLRMNIHAGRAPDAKREVVLGGQRVPLLLLSSEGEESWLAARLDWRGEASADPVVTVSLDRLVEPISAYDPRQAAALLTGAWLADYTPVAAEAPSKPMVLPLPDGQTFCFGWHANEHYEGRNLRWMSPSGTLLIPNVGVAESQRLVLVLSGPHFPYNVTDVPLAVHVNGQPMALRHHGVVDGRWTQVFEAAQALPPSPSGLEITLDAERSRKLGEHDDRIASILVDSVVLAPVGTQAQAAELLALVGLPQHEDWGTGLAGWWLPPQMYWVMQQGTTAAELRIEGAASTRRWAVEGLSVELESQALPAAGEFEIHQDGSWLKRFSLAAGTAPRAGLLRLFCAPPSDGAPPENARIMLRSITIEEKQA